MAIEKDLTAKLRTRSAFPVASLAIALASGLVYCFPRMGDALIYRRSLLLRGEIWRAWSGHIVHYSPGHVLWNLIIFLSAGCWLESIRPRSTRWFYALCPPIISASLAFADPALERYAGLSGVATGVLIFLALVQLSGNRTEPAWFWIAVVVLVAGKIALESLTRTPLLVHDVAGFHVVPVAHVSGACSGLVAWASTRRCARPTAS